MVKRVKVIFDAVYVTMQTTAMGVGRRGKLGPLRILNLSFSCQIFSEERLSS